MKDLTVGGTVRKATCNPRTGKRCSHKLVRQGVKCSFQHHHLEEPGKFQGEMRKVVIEHVCLGLGDGVFNLEQEE